MSIERYREIFGFPIRRYYETLGFDLQAESFADLCDQFMDRFLAKVGECPLAPGSPRAAGADRKLPAGSSPCCPRRSRAASVT